MIGKLTGIVLEEGGSFLILDVSGVGYLVFTPHRTFSQIKTNKELSLWVYTSVRETAIDLYGFLTKKEHDLFKLLITISGVGPKSALSVLNLAPLEQLASAIASGDDTYLTKVSGIGAKSAAKIILELKEKMEDIVGDSDGTSLRDDVDVLLALTTLGYTTTQGRAVLREIKDDTLSTSEKIKEALKQLAQ